jgi:hypothetical protein
VKWMLQRSISAAKAGSRSSLLSNPDRDLIF